MSDILGTARATSARGHRRRRDCRDGRLVRNPAWPDLDGVPGAGRAHLASDRHSRGFTVGIRAVGRGGGQHPDHLAGRRALSGPASTSRRGDADAELGAYGIANLFAGVFVVPPSIGIPARILANVRCGGTTRLSNLLHAVFLLLFLQFGSELIARVPMAALAGVTASIGIGQLEWSTWRRLHWMRRLDASAFLVTAASVLATNAVAAVAMRGSLYVARQVLTRGLAERPASAIEAGGARP